MYMCIKFYKHETHIYIASQATVRTWTPISMELYSIHELHQLKFKIKSISMQFTWVLQSEEYPRKCLYNWYTDPYTNQLGERHVINMNNLLHIALKYLILPCPLFRMHLVMATLEGQCRDFKISMFL
jgi:hypothetical protein